MSHPALHLPSSWCDVPRVAELARACDIGVVADTAIDTPQINGRPTAPPAWSDDGRCLCLDTPHAQGRLWLPAPVHMDDATRRLVATAHACGLARGFVEADAAVIAAMALCAVGRGASLQGFMQDPANLPMLGGADDVERPAPAAAPPFGPGLYALVDDAARVEILTLDRAEQIGHVFG